MNPKNSRKSNTSAPSNPPLVGNSHKKTNQLNEDGWTNIAKGLGRRKDASQSTTLSASLPLRQNELEAVWSGEGLGCRIVNVVAEDMTRAWVTLSNDPDNIVKDELKRLGAQQAFFEALQWTRLFGGAVMLLGTTDNPDLRQPLSATARPVTFLKVYPRYRTRITHHGVVTDPRSPYFDQPEYITIQRLDGTEFDVHISRLLTFHGPKWTALQDGVSWEDRYWGMSILQQPWSYVKALGSSFQAVQTLLQEFNIGVFRLSGLAELIATNNDRAVYNRIQIINDAKGLINSVLLGDNEEFRRDVAGVSGLPELLDRYMQVLSGVTGIPVTRLFGRSAAGLSATGENDLVQYYDTVASQQPIVLEPNLQVCIDRIAAGLGISDPVQLTFNPLWQPSATEQIDMRNKQAQTDQIYINTGVLTADEVRQSRFSDAYTHETSIEPGSEALTPLELENEELRAQLAALQASPTPEE